MKIIKDGNYSFELEVICKGYESPRPACGCTLQINHADIVKLGFDRAYGFICPKCHQFTEIERDKLPFWVRANAIQVAEKGSKNYDRVLTKKGKELSENLIISSKSKD